MSDQDTRGLVMCVQMEKFHNREMIGGIDNDLSIRRCGNDVFCDQLCQIVSRMQCVGRAWIAVGIDVRKDVECDKKNLRTVRSYHTYTSYSQDLLRYEYVALPSPSIFHSDGHQASEQSNESKEHEEYGNQKVLNCGRSFLRIFLQGWLFLSSLAFQETRSYLVVETLSRRSRLLLIRLLKA